MAGVLPADSLQIGMYEGALYNNQQLENGSREDGTGGGGRWYYSRKEIEENSASRKDGIDLRKETYLRKSYCTLLQDLGMRLKVIALYWQVVLHFIATVCMFLAGKVEETPRSLKDVILISYEIIHKKDPAVAQKIKEKQTIQPPIVSI